MSIQIYAAYILGVTLFSVVLYHIIGRRFAKKIMGNPAVVSNIMPGLPSVYHYQGKKRNWTKMYNEIKKKILNHLQSSFSNVEAYEIAGKFAENTDLVSNILEEISEQIPCRKQVTRKGKLIYDFKKEDVKKLKEKGMGVSLKKIFLVPLAFLANVGAVWPLILTVVVGILIIKELPNELSAHGTEGGIMIILMGFALFGAAIFLVWIFGLFFRGVLHPVLKAPRVAHNDLFTEKNQNFLTKKFGKKNKSGKSGGFFGFGDLFSGFDDDAGKFIIFIVLLGLLIYFIYKALSIVVIWFRNIFIAILREFGLPFDISPGEWTHTPKIKDKMKIIFSSNELVFTFMRSIKRFFSRTKPTDRHMPARILKIARQNNGNVSAIDIALSEEVSIEEACDLGAKLVAKYNGDIAVSSEGDMDFTFANEVLESFESKNKADERPQFNKANAVERFTKNQKQLDVPKEECLNVGPNGNLTFNSKGYPVNIPGISNIMYRSLFYLVGGSFVLTLFWGLYLFFKYQELNIAPKLHFLLPIPFAPLGIFLICGIFAYSVRGAIFNGLLRDIKRAVTRKIKTSHQAEDQNINTTSFIKELKLEICKVWDDVPEEIIKKVVEHTFINLNLDVDMQSGSSEDTYFSIKELYKRKQAINQLRNEQVKVEMSKEKDEVVFDSGW